jgi:hypothetical protein
VRDLQVPQQLAEQCHQHLAFRGSTRRSTVILLLGAVLNVSLKRGPREADLCDGVQPEARRQHGRHVRRSSLAVCQLRRDVDSRPREDREESK